MNPHGTGALIICHKLSLLENERYDFPKQDVLIGIIAPAFGCEGGGLQIKLPVSIHSLIVLGYIEEKF